MELIKPKKIRKGDVVSLIAPASNPKDMSRIEKSVRYFEGLGYRVKIGAGVGKGYGYLAATDDERLADLHAAFEDAETSMVMCVRGGYGTPRLLERIDYRLIKRNPKIFVGYSDITALSLAFLRKAKLVTFAGPMAAVDFWKDVDPYAEENFWRTVSSAKKPGAVPMPAGTKLAPLVKGKAEGALMGGNLALVAALAGSPYMPDPRGAILWLEEVGEPQYRVDRMLNQMAISGMLKKAAGVLLGEFTGCDDEPGAETLTLEQVFDRYLGSLDKPVVRGFPHGHVDKTHTIPFGVRASLDANNGVVRYLEPAVE
ncbi:MAG: LD-carboxypeptidase [Ignavibacteriales bacterium]|nr:LD-carboxypeptidase [Ignavibacteriales bacterium]